MSFRFQRKQRVKFLKTLFSYYGIVIALTVFALAVWGKYTNASLLSLLPLTCALILIVTAHNTSAYAWRGVRLTAFSYSVFESDAQQKVIVRIETIGQYLCLLGAPLLFFFIFFFPAAKIATSLSLLILPHVFVFVAGIIADVKYFKNAKKKKQKRESELEEQQKREELGKWK